MRDHFSDEEVDPPKEKIKKLANSLGESVSEYIERFWDGPISNKWELFKVEYGGSDIKLTKRHFGEVHPEALYLASKAGIIEERLDELFDGGKRNQACNNAKSMLDGKGFLDDEGQPLVDDEAMEVIGEWVNYYRRPSHEELTERYKELIEEENCTVGGVLKEDGDLKGWNLKTDNTIEVENPDGEYDESVVLYRSLTKRRDWGNIVEEGHVEEVVEDWMVGTVLKLAGAVKQEEHVEALNGDGIFGTIIKNDAAVVAGSRSNPRTCELTNAEPRGVDMFQKVIYREEKVTGRDRSKGSLLYALGRL